MKFLFCGAKSVTGKKKKGKSLIPSCGVHTRLALDYYHCTNTKSISVS